MRASGRRHQSSQGRVARVGFCPIGDPQSRMGPVVGSHATAPVSRSRFGSGTTRLTGRAHSAPAKAGRSLSLSPSELLDIDAVLSDARDPTVTSAHTTPDTQRSGQSPEIRFRFPAESLAAAGSHLNKRSVVARTAGFEIESGKVLPAPPAVHREGGTAYARYHQTTECVRRSARAHAPAFR